MATGARIHWNVFGPLLSLVLLTHLVVNLVRLAIVYVGIRESLDAGTVAIIGASYSLIPIFVTVPIGRLNDRGFIGQSALAGSCFLLVAAASAFMLSPTVVEMLVSNIVLGLGQTLLINSTQMMLTKASNSQGRDGTIGYYMIAASIGQVLGPALIAASAVSGTIDVEWPLIVGIGCGILLMFISCWTLLAKGRVPAKVRTESRPFSEIWGDRRLLSVVIGSAVIIGASDLVLIFVPLLGDERGIEPSVVGAFLAARALSAIPCRLFFGWLASTLGRPRLLVLSMLLGALSLATLLLDLPVAFFGVAVVLSGIGLGLAMPASLSITYDVAPAGLVGTATSLRTTAARITQFGAPFGAGLLATGLGTGGVFLVIGIVLGGAAWSLSASLSSKA